MFHMISRCRSKEITSFAGEGGKDAPWWELRFPTGVVEITIMEILSPDVLQCTVSAYTQMRDTTMRVDDTSFITSATASSGSGKEVVGPISAM